MPSFAEAKLYRKDRAKTLWGGLALLWILSTVPAHAAELSDLQDQVKKQQTLLQEQQKAMDELRKRLLKVEEHGIAHELKPQFGVNLGIFGDINYSTKNREGDHHGFSLGNLDLYSTGGYGERLRFLVELILEMERSGNAEMDPERLWVGYSFSDLFNIRAGRQHSSLGHWNETYHHGRQLFNTVDRPFFLAFEDDGGILPIHIVGIEMGGALTLSGIRWKYELDLGNGPRIDPTTQRLNPNITSDDNNSKQIILRVSARPDRYQGLTVGISGTRYRMDTAVKSGLQELVVGFDLSYHGGDWELLSEYFRMRNQQEPADAFYVQLGYMLYNSIIPYARYEYLDIHPADPYFQDLQNNSDRFQQIVGLRFDMDYLRSSLKVQYRHDQKDGAKTYNIMETQWSFSF